jgi:hypothetical protein
VRDLHAAASVVDQVNYTPNWIQMHASRHWKVLAVEPIQVNASALALQDNKIGP